MCLHTSSVSRPHTNYCPLSLTLHRYDLHEWLFTLHNALEAFQKRQLRAKARETQRQRASSTSSSSHGTTSTGSTPQLTPMRRAPPPPPGTSNKPPRRPSRPAPPAPGVQRRSREEPTNGATAIGREGESPPPAYTSDNSTPLSSQEPVATVVNLTGLESAQHPIMDLDLSQTEEAPPAPAHIRAASDTLVMMHETSYSMPDITAKHGDSSSQDEESQEEHPKPKPLTCMDSPSTRHTRHLSLTIGPDGTKPTRKKRSTKGSLKLRSRSPPNSPPPPPPPECAPTDSSSQDLPAQDPSPGQTSPVQTSPVLTSQTSNASLGFSDVMNTISNIDQQLDHMARSPPVAPHPQHSSSPTNDDHTTSKPSFSPVMAYREDGDFLIPPPQLNEAGQLVTAEDPERAMVTESAITKHIPPPHEFDNRDSAEPVDRELTPPKAQGERASEEDTSQQGADKPPQNNRDLKQKPAKSAGKNHRVMFKEEVEDIPPLYDPAQDSSLDAHRDQYEPRVDKEIPSTVAELKKMLFGAKSTDEVAKYTKEGPLSPRYTHPLNVSFGAEFHRDTSLSPSTTKEDIGPNPRAVNDKEGGGEDEEDGPYDTPWDQKPISKYSVVGRRSRDSLTSPIGERVQFGEVSTHEAPTPGNTELRNVHSLERPSKHTKHDGKHSLLESISDTLQVQSKYGSDSFLNGVSSTPQANGSPKQPISPQQLNSSAREPKSSPYNSPQQGRKAPRSTRGELEKIKAEHRRELQSSPHSSPQKVVPAPKPARQAGFSPKPALSASWDGNLRSTQVMYDANTQAHILRSLV